MTSFGQELLGGHGFSLIPLEGLHVIISTNFRLLLPTKFVVAYARKQMEKKVKVVNLPTYVKNGSKSRTTKSKSAKKGDDSFETCSCLVPYKGGLP